MEPTRSRPRAACIYRSAAILGLVTSLMWMAPAAQADRYDRDRAGHPVRIIAYALHPVGVVLDVLVMRPAHWLASHQPVKYIVGHEER